MTPVAANRFKTPTRHAPNRESGSQSDAKSNTKLEKLLRTGNLTNWKSDRADIQLLPSSCIDNYQDLVLRGNPVQLLPAETGAVSKFATADAGAMATRHQPGKLALRCRKLEIETAPTSQPICYKLYLAAGFVVYDVNGETTRAPILLIPVTIGRLRGRGSNYTVKYQTGSLFRVNPQVAEMCTSHIEQLVKPFESTTDLREYLRNIKTKLHADINCKISANTGIMSLQAEVLGEYSKDEIVDIELERTKPGIEFKPLPSTPAAFDPQLAIRILRFIAPDDLQSALRNFEGRIENRFTPVPDADPDLDGPTLEKYHNCAAWLIDVGLGHWKLKNIATLPRRVATMTNDINNLLSNNSYQKHLRNEFKTVDMLFRLNRVKDKILNSPPEMQHHAISQHADADTRLLLQKAKIQASSLEQEVATINETFHMGSVPSSDALHKLIKTISRREDEAQLTNPNYFRARHKLNEILKHPHGVLTDNDLQRLDSLAKTLKFAELFSNDPYYRRNFGSLFKGTDTNWQRLDSVVNYIRSLAQDLGSSQLVAQFADHWVSFERDFGDIAPQLENAASSAHKLCSLIPMFIDQNTQLEHAAKTAEKFRSRINTWQKYLHKHFADTELTPYQLLSNVALDDHNHPNITLPQQEFDERIYQHIVGGGLTPETVSATSQWLMNVIVRLQTDTPTVRRFLDKEAELLSNLA